MSEPEFPPIPGAEARWRGHSPPKGRTVPVGLKDEGRADAADDRAEFSEDVEETESIDLPADENDELNSVPLEELEGPIADATDSADDSARTSQSAEIDIAEFLADLNLGTPGKLEAAALPLIVPRPVPRVARQPLIEDWPRDGFPWQIVVHPAPLPVVEAR